MAPSVKTGATRLAGGVAWSAPMGNNVGGDDKARPRAAVACHNIGSGEGGRRQASRALMNRRQPSARNWQAGHSPQP